MTSPDGQHYLAFNGEIYNYVELRSELRSLGWNFKSTGDTEVLLAALVKWGPAALNRLTGMFALAFLDTARRTMLIARDQLGIKPLFYAPIDDGVAFASELGTLLEVPSVPRRASREAIFDYLSQGLTDHRPETMFEGILRLPPASYAMIALEEPGRVEPRSFWSPAIMPRDITLAAAAAEVRAALFDSVSLHLRSDVPVGVALSGGIDSSSLVGIIRSVEPEPSFLHTFTFVADGDHSVNEGPWARLVSEKADTLHHEIRCSPEDLQRDLPGLIRTQGEPFGGTGIYAQHQVFRAASEAGIKVMIDGQGADELFGGYRSYIGQRIASLVRDGRPDRATMLALRASRVYGARAGARTVAHALATLGPEAGADWMRRSGSTSWLSSPWFGRRPGIASGVRRDSRQALTSVLLDDVLERSLPRLLRYEDRNSMAFSVESRVPFATPAMVELALSLPEQHMISDKALSKTVLRHAMRGLAPASVLERRDKLGFTTPQSAWLASSTMWVRSVLASPAAESVHALRLDRITREWTDGRTAFRRRPIWRVLNLILWAEEFGVSFD